MKVVISIEQYERLEWAIELNGILWAAGDCSDVADGERQAREELAKAGIRESPTVELARTPKGRV